MATKSEIKKQIEQEFRELEKFDSEYDNFNRKASKNPGHEIVVHVGGRRHQLPKKDISDLKYIRKEKMRRIKELIVAYGKAKRSAKAGLGAGRRNNTQHVPVYISDSLVEFFKDPIFSGFSEMFKAGYMERGTINQLMHYYIKSKNLSAPGAYVNYDNNLRRFMNAPAGFTSVNGKYELNTSGASTAALIQQKDRSLGRPSKIDANGMNQKVIFSAMYLNSIDAANAARLGLSQQAQALQRSDVISAVARDHDQAANLNHADRKGRTSAGRASSRRSATTLSPVRGQDFSRLARPASPVGGRTSATRNPVLF